ncbi:MAG: efflux RND transporter periplasmic adaptor subunit [Synechococcaceae cyanobacterium]
MPRTVVPLSQRLVASLAIPALLLAGCSNPRASAPQPPAVNAITVGAAAFAPGIDLVSTIESTTNVVMRPEADGRVVRILAQQGQRVRAGQPILVLDNVQESAALDASRAEAIKDRVNAERYIFLNEQGAVSTKDRDFYVTQAIQSRDQVRANAATLGYKFVTAPIDGVLGNLDTVKLGDYVRQGQAITGIVDNSVLWTLMDVPATQASAVRLGLPVQVENQSTPPVRGVGRVVYISPYFNKEMGDTSSPNTVLVKAEFPNLSGRLRNGEMVRVRIITNVSSQLAIPASAVLMKASQPFVFRLLPLATVLPRLQQSEQLTDQQKKTLRALPGTTPIVVQTPVQLGPMQGNAFPVLAGLRPGERVVVSNTALLRNGMPVRLASAASGTESSSPSAN